MSSGLLLDLGILARLRGASPDPDVVEFLHRRRHQRIFISALTLCELEDGAGTAGGWLGELVERFASNILPVDHHIALACHGTPAGDQLEQVGSGGPGGPAVLAATARHHHLTVVSADAASYAGLEVRVVDPLAAPPQADPQ